MNKKEYHLLLKIKNMLRRELIRPKHVPVDPHELIENDELIENEIYDYLLDAELYELTRSQISSYLGSIHVLYSTLEIRRWLFPMFLAHWAEELKKLPSLKVLVPDWSYGIEFYHFLSYFDFLSADLECPDKLVVSEFMEQLILEQMLRYGSASNSKIGLLSAWYQNLSSYATVNDRVQFLWEPWWQFSRREYIYSAFFFAALFIPLETRNPILSKLFIRNKLPLQFLLRTYIEDPKTVWKPNNIKFLQNNLSSHFLIERLSFAISEYGCDESTEHRDIMSDTRDTIVSSEIIVQKNIDLFIYGLTLEDRNAIYSWGDLLERYRD